VLAGSSADAKYLRLRHNDATGAVMCILDGEESCVA
jgi:hypothetical protein